jgi:hypothetical protein
MRASKFLHYRVFVGRYRLIRNPLVSDKRGRRLPPKAEVRCAVATQEMTLMTETVAPVAKPVPRPRSRKPATVSASALALHLGCSRAYVGKLEAGGAIKRRGDGFPLDASWTRYIRFLRTERARSQKHKADTELARAKAETLQLELAQQRRQIVTKTDYDSMIDEFAGIVLTGLVEPSRAGVHRVAILRPAEP